MHNDKLEWESWDKVKKEVTRQVVYGDVFWVGNFIALAWLYVGGKKVKDNIEQKDQVCKYAKYR